MSKQNLELVVKPFKDYIPAELEFNYEEIKAQVSQIMDIYKRKVYTDETMKEAKADRAKLNKFSQAINRQRIDVGKEWKKPLDEFEKKIKEIDALVKEPIALIDGQVKDYEAQVIEEKLKEAEAYFIGIKDKPQFLGWRQVEQKDFSNLSKSMSQIKKDIDATIERVKSDWALIIGMKSEFEADMKFKYLDGLNLQDALALNQRLTRQKEERAAYEAKRKEIEATASKKTEVEDKVAEVLPETKEVPAEVEEQAYTIAFSVTGTKEQLMQLSRFMKQSGIKYTQLKA